MTDTDPGWDCNMVGHLMEGGRAECVICVPPARDVPALSYELETLGFRNIPMERLFETPAAWEKMDYIGGASDKARARADELAEDPARALFPYRHPRIHRAIRRVGGPVWAVYHARQSRLLDEIYAAHPGRYTRAR